MSVFDMQAESLVVDGRSYIQFTTSAPENSGLEMVVTVPYANLRYNLYILFLCMRVVHAM